jgi:hypothetical protein
MPDLRKEQKEEQRKKTEEQMRKLREVMVSSISEISKTKGGLNFLRFLMHESGFTKPNIAITEKGLDKDALLWNESRRVFYLDVRQFMLPEVVKLVELDIKQEEAKNDGA